jgi:MYXO-CTERM domain-containing protein
MIPLTAVPEFSVGSQPLFDAVRGGTVPLYDLVFQSEVCEEAQQGGTLSSPNGTNATGFDEGGASTGADETSTNPGPMVLVEETVGAFDVVVLQDSELAPIQEWLEMNGYNWDPSAGPILQQYIDEGNVIAALKLTTGVGLADVHPITLRYDSLETCFPLRLTRIAAVEDMDIRVFVLAAQRAAPTNYRHVLVNPLKIDWLTYASNYKQVITNAVDANMADGRAFVTEYAGDSAVVPRFGIHEATWNEQAFAGLDPTEAITVLNQQGLASCYDEFSCTWGHPLVYGLLLEFLPPPPGTDPIQFYPYLADYGGQIDLDKWSDGAGFAAALLDRVIEPGMHAEDLLDTWPYLTRMYTTISPSEMMEDPLFHLNPDLDDVPQLNSATNFRLCNGDSVVTLPDAREVYVPGGGPWPDIPGEEWWEEEVQTVALKGAPMTLVNNTAAITRKLEGWNAANSWPRATGESSTSSGADEAGGCGCRTGGGAGGALLGLVGLGWRLRGRRRR